MNKRKIAGLIFLAFAIGITLWALVNLQKADMEQNVLEEVLKQYCEVSQGEKGLATYEIQEDGSLKIICLHKKQANNNQNQTTKNKNN